MICTFKSTDGKEEIGAGQVQVVKSTMPPGDLTNKYAKNLAELAQQARYLVRDLEPTNDLTFLRIRCKKYEMMVAPDKEFFLIVIQCPEQQKNEWIL